MGKWPHIMLIAVGSILVGLGLGPLLVGGATELLGRTTDAISLTNFVIPLLIIAAFLLALVCSGVFSAKEKTPTSLQWLQHPALHWIVAGSIAVAYAAFLVADIDSANTSAWRNARQLNAEAGVNKRELREFGRQFARLSVAGGASVSGSSGSGSLGSGSLSSGSLETGSIDADTFGSIPLDWRTWVAGGRADVLLRAAAEPSADRSACNRQGTLVVAAAIQDRVLSTDAIQEQEACGQWRLIQLQMPRGTSELQIASGATAAVAAPTIDIMVAGIAPNFAWLWSLCTVLGIAAILTIVYLLATNLRDTSPVSRMIPSGSGQSSRRKRVCYAVGAIVLFVLSSNAFVHWYVAQEKTIYTWDYSGYWMSSRNVSDFLRGAERKSVSQQQVAGNAAGNGAQSTEPNTSMPDPGAIAALIRSVRFAEYNVSSNLPVAIVMAVFGGSRMVYELSLLNIYALGAALMLIVAVRGCVRNDVTRWPDWWPLIPLLTVVCCVPFWIPIMRGYMGVSVAAFNLAALWLYFRQPLREIGLGSMLAIGALLLSGVILQRWNAYWVVGFIVMAFADSVREIIVRRQFSFTGILSSMRVLMVSGFSAFFLFATIAWPKIERTVTTDYADLYSAFQEDDGLIDAVSRQVDAFGAGIWVLIVAALVLLAVRSSTRRVSSLLGVQVLCGFVLFANTQTMGPHQYFIVLPGLMILLSLGLIEGLSSDKRPLAVSGFAASALLLAFGLASGKSVFVYAEGAPDNRSTNRLLSQSYRPPLVTNDLESFIRLAQYVDASMATAPEGQGVYILSGSATLNANHLDTISASTGVPFNSADRILGSSVVDKRDGFPREIFSAHIVITSDPVQLSRRPEDQQVIRIPAARLFSGKGIGAAFERLPQAFRLDGGVDAVVFRRVRANTAEEVADLSAGLREFYPDRPNVYE